MFENGINRKSILHFLSGGMILILLALAVVGPIIPNTLGATTSSSGWLHTEGRWIKDGQGNIVTLSGINTYIRRQNIEAKFANASAEGFTTVRLILYKSDIENPTNYAWDTTEDRSGLAAIDKAVGWCQELGIRVILDQHYWNGTLMPAPIGFWTNTTLQQQWLNMWKLLVDRYKANPTVVGADLMNEPYATKTYGTPPANVEAIWEGIAENAITQLRLINPNLLFIAEDWGTGNQWQDVNFLKQNNAVYEPHLYYHDHITNFQWAESYAAGTLVLGKQQFGSWIDSKFMSYANQGVPVWVGETGFLTSDPYWQQEMTDQLQLLNERGIGYSGYAYGDWPMADPYNDITVSTSSDYHLTILGQTLNNNLLALTTTSILVVTRRP